MEIEGYDAVISTITLAKELHDMDRYDIVREHFSDILSWDTYFENVYGVITSIFSGFYNSHSDDYDDECLIFTDEYISRYYEIAWEYGRSHNVKHEDNPFVIEAFEEASNALCFCFSMGFKLLGYTKTKKAARQSKLIVNIGMCCQCDCHGGVANGLVQLYRFFAEKCEEFEGRIGVSSGLMAARAVSSGLSAAGGTLRAVSSELSAVNAVSSVLSTADATLHATPSALPATITTITSRGETTAA